jgi:hypothetical protein
MHYGNPWSEREQPTDTPENTISGTIELSPDAVQLQRLQNKITQLQLLLRHARSHHSAIAGAFEVIKTPLGHEIRHRAQGSHSSLGAVLDYLDGDDRQLRVEATGRIDV